MNATANKAQKFVKCAHCKAEVVLTDRDLRDTRWRCPECLSLNPIKSRKAKAQTPSVYVCNCRNIDCPLHKGFDFCLRTHQTQFDTCETCRFFDPPSEIIIEKRYSIWGIVQGSHFTELHDQNGQVFYDPMLASKYISATTQGHVRVLWNL